MSIELIQSLRAKADTKIVHLVMDGLGGAPRPLDGKTELETAHTPNLDALAARSQLGLAVPVRLGITPGSGPAHLALFGYDPIRYDIGRGVLEALGIGFELQPEDVAARGNFCSVDDQGRITDRRAGRIATEVNEKLVALLRGIELPGVQTFVETVKDYRFVLVLRPTAGQTLHANIADTDPQQLGVPPLPARAQDEASEPTAALVNRWIAAARQTLRDHPPANSLNLRGLAKDPGLPRFPEVYGLRAGAIATYPMYRGVARLVGMTVLPVPGDEVEDEVEALRAHWDAYDYFFFHVKKTDSAGEDGNFELKAKVIEHVDEVVVPAILALNPDVLIVTGDHSTPSVLKSHSWHPVPTLLWSRYCLPDGSVEFGERACARGSLGTFPATDEMPLAMGHALRLAKYGA
ncbi:MAG TPA: 2,3-bisphosphoglycerate-independent phosphoglycerate mutase [Anaerolineae bacterium]|nr:2,3-bisphosphoglycerate-independent phosphoglycerate mutase [Anaerolineae bacterium]